MKTLYIIDGNAYIHRAYHALPPLNTSFGVSVGAVYGFIKLLLKIKNTYKPDYLVVCFDYPAKNFRHEIYPEYKATRKPIDQQLISQMPIAREAAAALNIFSAEVKGYEADDLIAAIADKAQKNGVKTVIVTGDKDILQLVNDNVSVWNDSKDILYNAKKVEEKYGVSPQQFAYILALMGDASDNVPGVKGIGEKTALKLVKEYGSLENIIKHSSDVSGRTGELLRNGTADALKSLELVSLDGAKVDYNFDFKDAQTKESDDETTNAFFEKYEFKSLLKNSKSNLAQSEKPKHSVAASFETKTPPKIENFKFETVIVDDIEILQNIIAEIKRAGAVSVKTILNNVDSLKPEVAGISFALENKAYYAPLNHNDMMVKQIGFPVFIEQFKEVLEDKHIKKIGFDLKYERNIYNSFKLTLGGECFDVMLAVYCLDPSNPNDIAGAAEVYGITLPDENFLGKGSKKISFSDADVKNVADFACARAQCAFELYALLEPELKKSNLENLFNNIEMPLVEVLSDMEIEGIEVDKHYLESLQTQMSGEIKNIERKLYKQAGTEFNINSPKQIADIMFNKLGFPALKKTKTGYSTGEEVLSELAPSYPFAGELLKYREVQKLLSTYVEPTINYEAYYGKRIHTIFNQAVTTTGRLSSSDPNLQNIPVKTEYGRQIRKAFVASKGKTFFSADYSQIDLRVLADISGDEALIKAFKAGQDIHSATAREIFGSDDKNFRSAAKAINFGIVYGISPFGLSKQLGISVSAAKSYIDSYFARYAGVKRWMGEIVDSARRTGRVCTITGRIRYVDELKSSNFVVRQSGERLALNTPIQGTSADIIKIAMINIYNELKKRKLKSKLLLQVHDDLLAEVLDEEFSEVAELIKYNMEQAVNLKVPLAVSTAKGKNWGEMQ
jgi:DNA polymerase-1